MDNIYFQGQVLWSQIDANRHLRHSAYADFGAQARSNMLNKLGLSIEKFAKDKIGPILFREELIYFKEVRLDEVISVSVELSKLNTSNARFSFKHKVYKADGNLAAQINVDGAWMNLTTRKLTNLPSDWYEIIRFIPISDDYEEVNS